MVYVELLRCVFGWHNLGEKLDDSFHGWIRVCKKCGAIKPCYLKGRIEQIEKGHKEVKLFGLKLLDETPDILDISNRESIRLWRYRQIGQYKIVRPHRFKKGQDIIAEIDARGQISDVVADVVK